MNEYLPTEWEDEERMLVLMGPMPLPKETVSCQSRLNFWSSSIHKWAEAKKTLSFTIQESEMAFQRGSRVPLCLQDVLSHMLKKGELVTVEQLLENSKSTWLEWTKKNFLILPSQWAWKRLKLPFSDSCTASAIYVDMVYLKRVSDQFLNEYWSTNEGSHSNVATMSALQPLLSKVLLKSEDHSLILQYLSVIGKVCHVVSDGQVIVKFRRTGEIEVAPICEIEIARHRLKTAQKSLDERIKSLISEIHSCREDAKSFVKSGLKKQAYNKLRRKQILEKTLDSVTSTRDNLAICIDKLTESELNREVLGAFHCGVNALKKSLASSGSTESIEDTLDNLKEILDDCNEITDMISSPVDSLDISEDDLEKELITLMEKVTLEPVEDPLPDTPSYTPKRTIEEAFEQE